MTCTAAQCAQARLAGCSFCPTTQLCVAGSSCSAACHQLSAEQCKAAQACRYCETLGGVCLSVGVATCPTSCAALEALSPPAGMTAAASESSSSSSSSSSDTSTSNVCEAAPSCALCPLSGVCTDNSAVDKVCTSCGQTPAALSKYYSSNSSSSNNSSNGIGSLPAQMQCALVATGCTYCSGIAGCISSTASAFCPATCESVTSVDVCSGSANCRSCPALGVCLTSSFSAVCPASCSQLTSSQCLQATTALPSKCQFCLSSSSVNGPVCCDKTGSNPSSSSGDDSGQEGLGPAQIGAIVGCVVAVLVCIGVFVWRRRRSSADEGEYHAIS